VGSCRTLREGNGRRLSALLCPDSSVRVSRRSVSGRRSLSSKTWVFSPIPDSTFSSVFPVHVLRLLTMVSRPRSVQKRNRDVVTKKVRRRLISGSSTLEDISRRDSTRDGNRSRQRLFRRRRRADRDSSVGSPPPSFLPAHQQHALHDFLDRVVSVRTDLHECATCSERYYGMKMHTDSCDRCYREVRFWLIGFPSC
jgi:hypothetical protein